MIDNGGRDCGTDKITLTQALENSCNTTFLALADDLGLEKMLTQAEAFGFNSVYLDDLRPQARSVFPDDMDRPQTEHGGHRAVRGLRHPAADGDGGRRASPTRAW